ncbi:MAG TPA: energy-coupled thiamine transporter ThiT, partial [Ruminococcaceae bacterium]|nr:energy-coupled thiamine transporter ThiT [Oscillospiraceae bacterium]
MNENRALSKTRILSECAIMAALASVLAMVKIINLPNGGSVTLASMVPVVFIGIKHGTKWGALTGLVFALVQMITGFYAPPVQNFLNFVLVIMLDYILAFMPLGLAGVISKRFKNNYIGVAAGAFCVTFFRFIMHFLSGIIIWSSYATEGMPVWLYSLQYNGSYMGIEIIITTILTVFLT